MNKVIPILVSIITLSLSFPVLGAENPNFLFSRIKAQTQHARKAKLVIGSELPSASWVFSSMTPEEGCTVYLHSQLAKRVSSDHLAVLMAHEIAHCELAHHQQFREASDAELQHKQWEFEYEADALGLKLVRRMDFDARIVFAQVVSIFPDDPAHPSGKARVKAANDGEREYPATLISSEPLVAQGNSSL